jgi:hypothetical protein
VENKKATYLESLENMFKAQCLSRLLASVSPDKTITEEGIVETGGGGKEFDLTPEICAMLISVMNERLPLFVFGAQAQEDPKKLVDHD